MPRRGVVERPPSRVPPHDETSYPWLVGSLSLSRAGRRPGSFGAERRNQARRGGGNVPKAFLSLCGGAILARRGTRTCPALGRIWDSRLGSRSLDGAKPSPCGSAPIALRGRSPCRDSSDTLKPSVPRRSRGHAAVGRRTQHAAGSFKRGVRRGRTRGDAGALRRHDLFWLVLRRACPPQGWSSISTDQRIAQDREDGARQHGAASAGRAAEACCGRAPITRAAVTQVR